MAALVVGPELSLAQLADHLAEHLPRYAHPVFLRLRSELAHTGTFKVQKTVDASAGFDPAAVDDPLFVLDPATRAYRPLDAATYRAVENRTLKL